MSDLFVAVGPGAGAADKVGEYRLPEWAEKPVAVLAAETGDGVVCVPCEVWSRIVGYMRPVQAWNPGKQQEFADRQVFSAPPAEDVPDECDC